MRKCKQRRLNGVRTVKMKASCLVLRGSECTLSSSEARDPKPLSLPTSLPSSAQVTLGQGTGTEQVCVYMCVKFPFGWWELR